MTGESKIYNSFAATLKSYGFGFARRGVQTVQANLGKLCNQTCTHCHVDAGPNKTRENMDQKTAERLWQLIDQSQTVSCIDLTGGAPELNPHFRNLVRQARKKEIQVIDRCNLTVLFEKGQEDLATFLADNQVTVVASLPCYSEENVDKQRGNGVFDKSIRGLHLLNSLGYGKKGSDLDLFLVYNPTGATLPPEQKSLEKQYRERLKIDFDIEFTSLFTITNMPIKRFKFDLKKQGMLDSYMKLLKDSFNPDAVEGLMCFSTLSISWDGRIFDCDFNQMLEIPVTASAKSIWDINHFDDLAEKAISEGSHCFGCTAGAGSSCTGALVS